MSQGLVAFGLLFDFTEDKEVTLLFITPLGEFFFLFQT